MTDFFECTIWNSDFKWTPLRIWHSLQGLLFSPSYLLTYYLNFATGCFKSVCPFKKKGLKTWRSQNLQEKKPLTARAQWLKSNFFFGAIKNNLNVCFFLKKVLTLLKYPVAQVASFDDNQLSHIGIIEGKVIYDCYMICTQITESQCRFCCRAYNFT